MGDATDIILALSVMTIGLEALLFVFRGPLLRVAQAQALQRRIDAVQAEVTQAREQVATRQAEKTTTDAELAKACAALKQAEEDLAAGRRPREILLHRLGGPGGGMVFRASLAKVLPAKPEPERIRQDLANPALAQSSITEIAFGRGFNSSTHFSRSFREIYGIAPSVYRLLMQGSGASWQRVAERQLRTPPLGFSAAE